MVFTFSHVISYNIMFLQQYHAGHDVVIYNVLAPECHDMEPWPLVFLAIK